MSAYVAKVLLALWFGFLVPGLVIAGEADDPLSLVRGLIETAGTDFAHAKLAVDKFIDPSIDEAAALAELDRMVVTVGKMLGALPPEAASTSMEKMKALRAFIYEAGRWNDGSPFRYDLSDPYGQQPGAQSLTRYLATRKGNCVSMPMLFLALGERLGIDVTLSTAPLHIFVKFTDGSTGETWNLETTSGAGFTRDQHYRDLLPMTDSAIANGVYLKTMTRREALALIATGVLDHLIATGRYEEAVTVADVLIEANPADAYSMVKRGTAYYRLLERDFIQKYPKESDIPAELMPRAMELHRANLKAFVDAEALGWREPKLN